MVKSSWLSKFSEYVALWGVRLRIHVVNLAEFFRVAIRYYPHHSFFKMDGLLLCAYLGRNPFRLSKRFLLERGETDLYTYGETPLTTLELIAQRCGVSAQDTVFELGCGRGRTCFWLSAFIGCSVVGVEYVPVFIEKAEQVKKRLHIPGLFFRLEDLFQTDLTGATVIYLYGICFTEAQLVPLIQRFSHLPSGTKVITVSYSLTECLPEAPFRVVSQFTAPFTWGEAEVYLQLRV